MSRRSLRRLSFGAVALLVLGTGLAALSEIPPAPDRWATDKAGFLSVSTVDALDAELESYERSTGRQVLVYIDRSTGGIPLEDWAFRAFQAWKVGRKSLDDGLAVFIMAEDRKIRIEVGYGLEALVPDITAGRVINDVMIPSIRSGENDRAVREGVSALLGAISGEPGAPVSEGTQVRATRRLSTGEKIFAGAAILFFLIFFITNPSLALWLLFSLLSG
ncbi:MAG TPA: TPM domain-containing protein, partial [Acidobacteriota bacterium]|nr:TPM domain-containing protein [Acidobacteriota bacterium]